MPKKCTTNPTSDSSCHNSSSQSQTTVLFSSPKSEKITTIDAINGNTISTQKQVNQITPNELIPDYSSKRHINNHATQCIYCDNLSLTKAKRKFGLKKQIGLAEAVSVISGVIIGSGIFMTPGDIIESVESVGMSILVWVICGFFAMAATLSYMELGLIINESGAEYPYCIRAYGDTVGFLCSYGIALRFGYDF